MSKSLSPRGRGRVRAPTPLPPRPPALPERSGLSFARGLWRLAAADVSAGNALTLFSDGDQTFDAMIAIIDGATTEVSLESYILKSDTVGQRFADALSRAAARGVRARLLTDWVGMRGTSGAYVRALRAAGVEVRVFGVPGFHAWLGAIPRDHRKVLVADGAVGLTGGIGLGDEWQRGLLRKRSQAWRDTCVRIAGPAAQDLATAFNRMWARAGGEVTRREERLTQRVARNTGLDLLTCKPSLVGIVEGEPWRFRIARALHLQAAAAQRSIWIASAYFVPSFAEVDALIGAARDGVDVRLLVPSKYDHPWIHGFTKGFYRRMLRNGVRVWEWSGEMMHAKTSVIDGRWVRVGSTDFNFLSVALNYELDAMIEDPVVGAAAETMFENDLAMSAEITHAPAV